MSDWPDRLVTRNDYLNIPGVVQVDHWTTAGHIELYVRSDLTNEEISRMATYVAVHKQLNLTVAIQRSCLPNSEE